MRNEYPPTITPDLFPDAPNVPDAPGPMVAPVRRGPAAAPQPNQIGPMIHGVSEFWLETPVHVNPDPGYAGMLGADMPPGDPHRRHFAPKVDASFLRWNLEGPTAQDATYLREAITLRVELFVGRVAQACWRKELRWTPGTCPVQGRLPFSGVLEDGVARVVDGDGHFNSVGTRNVDVELPEAVRFSNGVLSIDQSPYRLKLSIVAAPHLRRRTPARWLYFDVRIHSLVVRWGNHNTLRQNRADVLAANEARVLAFEQDVLTDLQGAAPNGQGLAAPTAGQVHKLRLESNLFPVHAADQPNLESYANNADFQSYRDLWGNGARVPIEVEALMMRSNSASTDQVPEALGRARLLWDCQEGNPNRWQDPLSAGAAPYTKPFLDHVHHKFDPAPKPDQSQNCPISFGGKQGPAPVAVFPDQAAPADFPYTVTACPTRTWAAWSEFSGGRSGVVFQPARMAGDGYAITAYLDLDREANQPGQEALATVAPLQTPVYPFLVQRKTKLFYLVRGGNADIDADPAALEAHLKTVYERELHMVVDVQRSAVNNAQYIASLNAARQMRRPYTNGVALAERGMIQALPWFLDYLIDQNPAANSPGIPFRTWAQFQQGVANEFQNGVLREFDGVGNAGVLWGQRFTGQAGGASGILLRNAAPHLVLMTGGVIANNENIVGGTTNDMFAIGTASAKRSCPTVNFAEYPPPPGAAAATYESSIHVTVGGGAPHIVGFRKPFGHTHFRTDLVQLEEDNLRAYVAASVAAHADANALAITITAKQTTPRSLQRLQSVRAFLQALMTSGDEILVRDRVWARMQAAGDPLGWECLPAFGRRHQSTLALALLGDVIKRYADLNFAGQEGIFLMHVPGRFNGIVAPGEAAIPREPRVAGAFYGEATGVRTRSVGYLATIPAANALPLETRNADSILCHEVGHALFLPHQAGHAPGPHVECHVGGDACIMNYELNSAHFCGFCMVRVRGWDWRGAALHQGKLIAVEIRDGGAPAAPVYIMTDCRQYTNLTEDAKWVDAARLDGQEVRIANTDRTGRQIRARLVFSSGAAMLGYQLELLSGRDSVAYYPAEKRAHAAFNFERAQSAKEAAGSFVLRNGDVRSGTTNGEGRVVPEDITFDIPSPAVGDKYKIVAWDENDNTVYSGEVVTWRAAYYAVVRGGSAYSVTTGPLRTNVETTFQASFTDMIFAGEEPAPTLVCTDIERKSDAINAVLGYSSGPCLNLPGRNYPDLQPMLARMALVDHTLNFRYISTNHPNIPVPVGPAAATVRTQIRSSQDVEGFDARRALWLGLGPPPFPDAAPLDPAPGNDWYISGTATLADGSVAPIPYANLTPVQTAPAVSPGLFNEVDVRVDNLTHMGAPIAATTARISLRVGVALKYVLGMARLVPEPIDPPPPPVDPRGIFLVPARRRFTPFPAMTQVNAAIHEFGHALAMVATMHESHLVEHRFHYQSAGEHCRFGLADAEEYQTQANQDTALCVMFGFASSINPRTQFCTYCKENLRKIDSSAGLL